MQEWNVGLYIAARKQLNGYIYKSMTVLAINLILLLWHHLYFSDSLHDCTSPDTGMLLHIIGFR